MLLQSGAIVVKNNSLCQANVSRQCVACKVVNSKTLSRILFVTGNYFSSSNCQLNCCVLF